MNYLGRNVLIWGVLAAIFMAAFSNLGSRKASNDITYSEFRSDVLQGVVSQVEIDGYNITGLRKNGDSFKTSRPALYDPDLIPDLLKNKVAVSAKAPERQSIWKQLLVASFPILLIVAIFLFFMRQMQNGLSGRGGPMSFGRSKARLMTDGQVDTTFSDVAGIDESKDEVQELVEFLRNPEQFQKLGGRIPRGVLMVGSPGTGKTLLARAIAGEAKVAFFSISGSDFVEMFVGVGASRVRDLFEQAKQHSPCIIFVDEIDAVGRRRGAGLGGGHDEREQTLNQLLVEMDGFQANQGIIVIAATNRPDVLDPALLRPGRFDRQVVVPLPDIRGREQILRVHMKPVPIDKCVKPDLLARGTPGFSGADLANLVNEAALFAARTANKTVTMEHFDRAKDKIMMGSERRSMVMSEKEKRNTAYHEAGHAIVGLCMPDHDPVYKVTIIPRGPALGVTMFLPKEDRYSFSKQGILSQICSLFGGRIAEEMTLGADGITTGASNDIERATQLAHNMVTKWGLSNALGPIKYSEDQDEVFLGMSSSRNSSAISEATAAKIDKEIRMIMDECYFKAKTILQENKDKLKEMAEALVDRETLNSEEIDHIMAGGTMATYATGSTYGDSNTEKPSNSSVGASTSDPDSDSTSDSDSDKKAD